MTKQESRTGKLFGQGRRINGAVLSNTSPAINSIAMNSAGETLQMLEFACHQHRCSLQAENAERILNIDKHGKPSVLDNKYGDPFLSNYYVFTTYRFGDVWL